MTEHAEMVNFGTMSRDEFASAGPSERMRYLSNNLTPLDVLLYSEQFNEKIVREIFDTANHIEDRSRQDVRFPRTLRELLVGRSCALYFPQCSTRTFVSFSLAAQSLGMMVEEIRDVNLSAEYKGESELDTLLTLSSLADTIVVREQSGEVAERMAFEIHRRGLKTKLVNGGSGSDQHPTQGLLELYTLYRSLNLEKSEEQFKVAMVGDLARSRTARALSRMLGMHPNVEQVFVAPEGLQMGDDILDLLDSHRIQYSLTSDFDEVLPKMNAVYMMRIQDEYGTTSEELRAQYEKYHLSAERAELLNKDSIVIHPLPRRNEIPLAFDDDPRARYWSAVSYGKTVRIALLGVMHGVAGDILGL